MLENNKKLESVDVAEVFTSMLRGISWDALKAFIQSNSQINKICTQGGHRLDKKRRKRFEKIICREAAKKDFASEICSGIFAQWYPMQTELHEALEKYFESDDYKKYRQEEDVGEDEYFLTDEMFNKIFDPQQVEKWQILLCFSPLKFSDSQADRIIEEAQKNGEVLQDVHDVRAETEKERQEKNRLINENNDLRKRLEDLSEVDKEIRTERKQLRAACQALEKKFETAQAENLKLKEKIAQIEKSQVEQRQEVEKSIEKDKKRLLADLKKEQAALANWKEKYESQRSDTRQIRGELKKAEKALAAERTARMSRDKEFRQIESFADAVLARIDWRGVGREMKLTPQLKRKFNSLMRTLNYEKDRSLTLGGTLRQFWNKLQKQETNLIEAVADSDTREVKNGDVEEYWRSLTDDFQDVSIGLEARTILLQLLQETFYQTLSMEDLEEVKPPGISAKKKKKSRATKKKRVTA